MSLLDDIDVVTKDLDEVVKNELRKPVEEFVRRCCYGYVHELRTAKVMKYTMSSESDEGVFAAWVDEIYNDKIPYVLRDSDWGNKREYMISTLMLAWDKSIQNWVILILNPKLPIFINLEGYDRIPEGIIFKPIKRVNNLYFYEDSEYYVTKKSLKKTHIKILGKSKVNILKYL